MLALVGWTDWLLLWFPFRLGVPEWEFGTISGAFDAMALGTIGFLVLATVVARGGTRTLGRVLALTALGVSLLCLVLWVLYLLNVPLAVNAVQPELKGVLEKSVIKTSLLALFYAGGYGALGVYGLRLLNVKTKGAVG